MANAAIKVPPQTSNPYETLDVPRNAGDALVRMQYLALALIHHPDKYQNSLDATANFRRVSLLVPNCQ